MTSLLYHLCRNNDQSYSRLSGSTSTPTVYNPLSMHPPALTQQISDERDFRMDVDNRRKPSFGRNRDAHMDDEENVQNGRSEPGIRL